MDVAQQWEVGGAVTRSIVDYMRRRQGVPGVRSMLEIAGEYRATAVLEDEHGGSSLVAVIALFDAAELLTGDPAVTRRIGEHLVDTHLAEGAGRVGTLDSPARALRGCADIYQRWWGVGTIRVERSGRSGASAVLRLDPAAGAARHACLLAQGVLSHVTVPFGLPPATIVHPQCQVRGADVCRFELTWPRWRPITSRLLGGGSRRSVAAEVELLQERIADLESSVAELVSTDDLDEALARIAARAAAAVRGQRFVLLVHLPDETSPRVHSAGFAREEATRLARGLMVAVPGSDAAPDRVIAEIVSARHRYGWLAAYPGAGPALASEYAQLEAYARLAAAALDAASALADARRGDATAQAVLGLARELTSQPDEASVAQRVVAAVSTAVGSDRASLLLLDADGDVLRTVAVHGFGDRTGDALAFEVVLDTAPALAVALTDPTARLYTAEDPDPWVRQLTTDAGAEALAVAPMVIREEFVGLIVANWPKGSSLPVDHESVFRGLTGLADHAGIALAGVRTHELGERRKTLDPMTGLADQAMFDERLSLHLADRRRGSATTAVCAIDLDGLPTVDHRLWGDRADPILVEVTARIRQRLRETDSIARISAHELVVLLCGLDEPANAEQVAVDLVAAFSEPIVIDDARVDVGVTVGIAYAFQHGSSAGELLQAARTAMHEAKADEVVYRVWQPPPAPPPGT